MLHAKIIGKHNVYSSNINARPEPKFKGGDMVKPADHCNNGEWTERLNFASFFGDDGEWWYRVDCFMHKGATSHYAESTLQLAI